MKNTDGTMIVFVLAFILGTALMVYMSVQETMYQEGKLQEKANMYRACVDRQMKIEHDLNCAQYDPDRYRLELRRAEAQEQQARELRRMRHNMK